MTIDEKKNALMHMCASHRPLCYSNGVCPLYELEGKRSCYGSDDEETEKNYAIVFGDDRAVENEPAPENIMLHATICDELKALYQRKNTDYGDSFHKTFVEEGMAMARIRLSDKMERFKRLTRSGEQNVKEESVRDTLIDLANYAIMTIVEMERVKND